ncbi:HesA/MoeB/ThiF family protein [Bdellovibrionota bacterium FG-1]
MPRYSRQTILKEIGPEGQARLGASRVLCVGVGGLGSPAALYLAAAGLGEIGLMDPDRVRISNLQRQILFGSSDDGQAKTQCAERRLRDLNPEIKIRSFPFALDSQNALSLFQSFDLVIDGTDNFSAKYLINDAAYKAGIPVIYGSIQRFEGQVALFNGHEGPCYRCLFPEKPKTWIPNCAESGILGPVAGVIGSMQALLTIRFLVSKNSPSHPLHLRVGQLMVWDALNMSFDPFTVKKRVDCSVCSKAPQDVRLECDPPSCGDPLAVHGEQPILIDVRELDEWLRGHIPGAIHWPLSQIQTGQQPPIPLDREKAMVLYCHAGVRSARALEILKTQGFKKLSHLARGILDWSGP